MTEPKVVKLNAPYYGNLQPDQILEGARGKLTGVLLIGVDDEGEPYCASSYGDAGTNLILIERFKQFLLNACES